MSAIDVLFDRIEDLRRAELERAKPSFNAYMLTIDRRSPAAVSYICWLANRTTGDIQKLAIEAWSELKQGRFMVWSMRYGAIDWKLLVYRMLDELCVGRNDRHNVIKVEIGSLEINLGMLQDAAACYHRVWIPEDKAFYAILFHGLAMKLPEHPYMHRFSSERLEITRHSNPDRAYSAACEFAMLEDGDERVAELMIELYGVTNINPPMRWYEPITPLQIPKLR